MLGEVAQGLGTLQGDADVGHPGAHPALPGRLGRRGAVAVEGAGEVADLALVVQVGDLDPQVAGRHLLGAGGEPDQGHDEAPPHEGQVAPPEQQQVGDQQHQRGVGSQRGLAGQPGDVVVEPLQQRRVELLDGLELAGDHLAELRPRHHPGGPGELAALDGLDDLRRQGQIGVVALLQALQAQALLLLEADGPQQPERRLPLEAHAHLGLELAPGGQISGGGITVQGAVGLVQALQDALQAVGHLGLAAVGLQARVEVMQRQGVGAERQGREQGAQRNEPTMNAQNRHGEPPFHEPRGPAGCATTAVRFMNTQSSRGSTAGPRPYWR